MSKSDTAGSWLHNKDVRTFIVSVMYLLLILGVLAVVIFVQIPQTSKELVMTIVGVLLAGLSASLGRLFGKNDEDLDALRKQHEAEMHEMRLEMAELRASYVTLKGEHDRMTKMLLSRVTDIDRPEFEPTQPAKIK